MAGGGVEEGGRGVKRSPTTQRWLRTILTGMRSGGEDGGWDGKEGGWEDDRVGAGREDGGRRGKGGGAV